MNIHEYQAKALFEKFGVPVSKGASATLTGGVRHRAAATARRPDHGQSPDPRRRARQGRLRRRLQGRGEVLQDKADARRSAAPHARQRPGDRPDRSGRPAGAGLYFTVASEIKNEYYLAILLDRASAASRPRRLDRGRRGNREGGARAPRKDRQQVLVDPAYGLADFQVRELVFRLGFSGRQVEARRPLVRPLRLSLGNRRRHDRDQSADHHPGRRRARARRQDDSSTTTPSIRHPGLEALRELRRGGSDRDSRPPSTPSATSRSTAHRPAW